MIGEIINVGSEFLRGRISGSGPLISFYMSSVGIETGRMVTVPDDPATIAAVLAEALKNSDIIFLCGGMGSSKDDLTRDGAGIVLKKSLLFSRRAMENVAAYFARKGLDIPRHCDNQAEIFEGAEILPNSKGSCPGQLLEIEPGKILILLPGHSEEVESIFKKSLLGILKERYETCIRKRVILRFAGICEGSLPSPLKKTIEIEEHLEEGEVEFYFETTPAGSDIHIIASGRDELMVDELLHKTKAEIYNDAGEYIYGENFETLQDAAGRLLGKKRQTISVAESCTGGLISSKLTDVPGSSIYFQGGIISYSSRAKIEQLKVNSETLKKYSPVSPEVAIEMAVNVKDIFKADYGLSVTGYAGPSSPKNKKAGYAFAALSGPEETSVSEIKFGGDRRSVKEKFACMCIEKLWKVLKK